MSDCLEISGTWSSLSLHPFTMFCSLSKRFVEDHTFTHSDSALSPLPFSVSLYDRKCIAVCSRLLCATCLQSVDDNSLPQLPILTRSEQCIFAMPPFSGSVMHLDVLLAVYSRSSCLQLALWVSDSRIQLSSFCMPEISTVSFCICLYFEDVAL